MYVCRELLLLSQLKWVLWSLPSSPLWGGGCCCYGLPVLLARWSFPICALWCGGLCCSRLPFPPPLVWMGFVVVPFLPPWCGGVLLFWVAFSSGCVVVSSPPGGVEGLCCFGSPVLLVVWSFPSSPSGLEDFAVLGCLFILVVWSFPSSRRWCGGWFI